ncbi:MAG: hypothetical protein JWQ21_3973 [Herminiimonas sp.]|nr:hypothetical protein [Herminiimonas sp.]
MHLSECCYDYVGFTALKLIFFDINENFNDLCSLRHGRNVPFFVVQMHLLFFR